MSRESLVRKAVEMTKLLKDSRAVLRKAMDEDALEQVTVLSQRMLDGIARFVQDPQSFNMEDYYRLLAVLDQTQELLNRALIGQNQTPIRKRAKGSENQDSEESEDEKEPVYSAVAPSMQESCRYGPSML